MAIKREHDVKRLLLDGISGWLGSYHFSALEHGWYDGVTQHQRHCFLQGEAFAVVQQM